MDRLRWSCRRGLLELDLVLQRFLREEYPLLGDEQKQTFSRLLGLPDNDLLDLAMGRADTTDEAFGEIVQLMRK
ncbi:succinate dehydrogenase assembly factor 2 [Burkholderiales bacterium]|jgi:antitoxin CptB|nr:succinate dehydrogenase assembly factor 2 [Burkholderiales bacterium]MDA9194659.1 succinate dehydrogenase assembly factor 2 [Burkholderiales bacterium]MDA9994191.1 succinate dehydrogenase assembly factor 2 [Burkholderiales bacterium]MDG1143738.1 succinate dehydrogenase assembly factor 2 [Burkholderiales bacterium]